MGLSTSAVSRHQCLIYEGAPSRQLAALAGILRQKLADNYRCVYLNSPVMVAGMRCYLAAAGVDVEQEIASTSLLLSSERKHLVGAHFDIDLMLDTLANGLDQSLKDGYQGLWATGDMTWELGPLKDLAKLIAYECRLEDFFRTHSQIGGICQYHADSLPREALRQGLIAHQSLFINETLSRINPLYLAAHPYAVPPTMLPQVDATLEEILRCDSD